MKYRTEWNLDLLYKGDNDPQIEKDIELAERAIAQFEKKYRGKDFTSSVKKIASALNDYETLIEKITPKASWYFGLRTNLDSNDKKAVASETRIDQRMAKAQNVITFFFLEIGKISVLKQKEFLAAPLLQHYRYFLERLFIQAKYNLTEKEEQLLQLLSQPGYRMWVESEQRLLAQQTIDYNGAVMPLEKAIRMISDLPQRERELLDRKVTEVFKANAPIAEAELNAIYNYKKITDELRGYKKPYSATVLHYENDEKTVDALVAAVTKHFSLSKRFYTLQAKLLRKKKLKHHERNLKIGEIRKKFDFDTSVSIVQDLFLSVHTKYKDIFDAFLANGQIDVYPKKGKSGGAFCSGLGLNPTFVLLNHNENIRSVETIAHEMGHAIHTEFSKHQPALYRDYTIATAEVASTFFEQVVVDGIQQFLTPDEQIVLLHNKIAGDMQTIFRQIAFFNFEVELHNAVREQGQVAKEEIAALMQKHLQSYLGPAFEITQDDGYFFVYLSHIRRYFYVYTYAYGQLVSRALYKKWKENPKYEIKIDQFLSAGGSMSPKDIFKSAGITTNEAFFIEGLKSIEEDVSKLEKLAKKLKKI